MKWTFFWVLVVSITALSACGYRGDLYLPREQDEAKFEVIPTGIDFRKPNVKQQHLTRQPSSNQADSAAE